MMPRFEPRDPDFETKVRESFGRQTAMQTLGAVETLKDSTEDPEPLPPAELVKLLTQLREAGTLASG